MFDKNDFPGHIFNITELDFSSDLFCSPLKDPWFRLGMWTIKPFRDENRVENVVSRQSILIPAGTFSTIVERHKAIGDLFHNLGKPGGYTSENNHQKQYNYEAFHQVNLPFDPITGETLVFVRFLVEGTELFINPDLYLFFKLEERDSLGGTWWDPRKGVEALRRRKVENDNLEIVEIRTDYLLKYLQARQLALLVGHYKHLHLYEPDQNKIDKFVKEDVELKASDKNAKVVMENWGFRTDILEPLLQRRLHFWFQIKPPAVDLDDPWIEQPTFDVSSFTLPTRVGPVAPARFNRFRDKGNGIFAGEQCDFMERVYFKQEVLSKYEGASGFQRFRN